MQEAGMRVRHWVLVGSISVGLGGALAAGCGSTSSDNPATDAGTDTSTADVTADQSTGQDTGADVKETGPTGCVEDASIATLSPPDASLADGATSTGICL